MKRNRFLLPVILFCGLAVVSCQSGRGNGSFADSTGSDLPIALAVTGFGEQYPVFSVAETSYDFDTIHAGEVVTHAFRFRNTGSKPLIIRSATSTCGCTVPTFPRQPVRPGEEGVLKVVFNSAGKSGNQVKPVFITANTMPARFQLRITADVLPPRP